MASYLYILYSKSGNRHYIGVSDHPETRLTHHNTTETGFTSRYRPWEIIFTKAYPSRIEAMAAERKLKSWKNPAALKRYIAGEIEL